MENGSVGKDGGKHLGPWKILAPDFSVGGWKQDLPLEETKSAIWPWSNRCGVHGRCMVDAGQIKLALECQAEEGFETDTMSLCKSAWSWCTRQGSGQARHEGTPAVPLPQVLEQM